MYNTRRGGAYGSPASNVGQRRPNQGNYGQPRPQGNMQQAPVWVKQGQTPPAGNLQKTSEATIQQQKAQEPKFVPKSEPQATSTPQPKPALAPQLQQQQQPQQPPAAAPQPVPAPMDVDLKNESTENSTANEDGSVTLKPQWRNKKGKISKAEKARRRNQYLKKILQPKNALMVLNEIAGITSYDVIEMQPKNMYDGFNGPNFKASVSVDGQLHEGFGKNKPAAKTAAAETALKHLVMTKMTRLSQMPPPAEEKPVVTETTDGVATDGGATDGGATDGGDEKMEEDTKDENISYGHLASFALYKLFTHWDESGKQILTRSNSHSSIVDIKVGKATNEMKPSKKMPDNPEQMNPVMLLNQMYPNAVYEEVCKTGVPPKIVFTMKCTINDKAFIGHGQNKKLARREAAYQACRELLGVQYPETTNE